MKIGLAVFVLLTWCTPAAAQQDFGVGASTTLVAPRSEELTRAPLRLRPLIRLQPAQGWGFAFALNWFDVDVEGAFAGVNGDLGRLEVKPVMVGVGYTWRNGRVATNVSTVAGPAWNRLIVRPDVREAFAALGTRTGARIDRASAAVRPGVAVSIRIAPRLDLIGFGGYLINRPKFTIRTPGGNVSNVWTTDSLVLSTGLVFALF